MRSHNRSQLVYSSLSIYLFFACTEACQIEFLTQSTSVDTCLSAYIGNVSLFTIGERGGSVVECRTLEREVGGSRPTAAVLCPWARHFTPWKYWLITLEAVAPSRHDWKIVDWDVKPQHKQTKLFTRVRGIIWHINATTIFLCKG